MLTITNPDLAEIKRQYLRLPVAEQRRWRTVLRRARQLDEQLADLHLAFPAIEIRFYRLDTAVSLNFSPQELLQAIATWHADADSLPRPRPR